MRCIFTLSSICIGTLAYCKLGSGCTKVYTLFSGSKFRAPPQCHLRSWLKHTLGQSMWKVWRLHKIMYAECKFSFLTNPPFSILHPLSVSGYNQSNTNRTDGSLLRIRRRSFCLLEDTLWLVRVRSSSNKESDSGRKVVVVFCFRAPSCSSSLSILAVVTRLIQYPVSVIFLKAYLITYLSRASLRNSMKQRKKW